MFEIDMVGNDKEGTFLFTVKLVFEHDHDYLQVDHTTPGLYILFFQIKYSQKP